MADPIKDGGGSTAPRVQIPGVVSITDLSAIGPETLQAILRAPEPPPAKRERRLEQGWMLG